MLEVVTLVTEDLVNPIGMDERLPRFSWQLVSDQKTSNKPAIM